MATQTKDYYSTLGVKRGATAEEIRKAFRKLARRVPPGREPERQAGRGEVQGDLRGQRCVERRKEAEDLRPGRVLFGLRSIRRRRRQRRAEGMARDSAGDSAADFRAGRARADAAGRRCRSTLAGSIFRTSRAAAGTDAAAGRRSRRAEGSAEASRTSSAGCSAAGTRRAGRGRGQTEYQVSVDFWSAVRGGVARLEIQRQEVCPACKGKSTTNGGSECPECHGTGQVTQMGGRMKFNIQCPRCGGTGKLQHGCPTCNGEGVVTRREPLEFRIKAGTRDGQRIRLAGRGNAGTDGGAAGDLFLIVKVGTHPVFTRVADDIHVTVPVTMTEAALGAKIEVPTIDTHIDGTHEGGGRTQLKIPPGTQTGQKLRLREKGVPSAAREGVRGDEIVEVRIVVPHVQDERSKEILRELAKLNPQDPRAELLGEV